MWSIFVPCFPCPLYKKKEEIANLYTYIVQYYAHMRSKITWIQSLLNSTESYSVPSPLYLSFNSCGIHQMEIVLFSEYVTMCLFQCYWMLGLLFDKGGPVAHGQKLFSKPMRALQEQYRMLNETVHELITQSKDAPQSPLLCFVCGVIDHVQL